MGNKCAFVLSASCIVVNLILLLHVQVSLSYPANPGSKWVIPGNKLFLYEHKIQLGGELSLLDLQM